MKFIASSISELGEVANYIQEELTKCPIVLFHGDLGAGKTTLIKEIGSKLRVTSTMSSPSFGIVNEYETPNGLVYHIDLYRIKDVAEIYEFGLPEILDSGSPCFIEWPEKVEEIWHDYDHFDVHMDIINSTDRRIFVK